MTFRKPIARLVPRALVRATVCLLALVGIAVSISHTANTANAGARTTISAAATGVSRGAMHATSARMNQGFCYEYDIPPDDCFDGTGADGTHSGGNAEATDAGLWPTGFMIMASYHGHNVLGYAHQSAGSTYRFEGTGVDGCYVIGSISLKVSEAIMIDLGIPTNIDNWTVTGAQGC